jgi:hypothetical protein
MGSSFVKYIIRQPPQRGKLEPHGVIFQNTASFIVTALIISQMTALLDPTSELQFRRRVASRVTKERVCHLSRATINCVLTIVNYIDKGTCINNTQPPVKRVGHCQTCVYTIFAILHVCIMYYNVFVICLYQTRHDFALSFYWLEA